MHRNVMIVESMDVTFKRSYYAIHVGDSDSAYCFLVFHLDVIIKHDLGMILFSCKNHRTNSERWK